MCEGCGTIELNKRIKGLVKNLNSTIPKGVLIVSRDDEEELRKQREEELKNNIKDDIENLKNKRMRSLNVYIGSSVQSYDYRNKSSLNKESIRWVLLGNYYIKLKYHPFRKKTVSIRHEMRFSDNSIVSTGYYKEEIEGSKYIESNVDDLNFETSIDYNFYFNSASFWLGIGAGTNKTNYTQTSENIVHNIKHQTIFISLTTGIEYNFENFGLSMYGSEYGFPIYQKHEYKINKINIESNIVKTGHLNIGISFFY